MSYAIVDRAILSTGKFLVRAREPDVPTNYSVGYSFSRALAGVSMRLSIPEGASLHIRMTPEQAEQMAGMLVEWAGKTRKYQSQGN